jgi:hypothetical protein
MSPKILYDNIENIYAADELAFLNIQEDTWFGTLDGNLEKLDFNSQDQYFYFNKNEAAILNYLIASNFCNVYKSETFIGGYRTTCLILDEDKFNDSFKCLQNQPEQIQITKYYKSLEIDRFPLLPSKKSQKKHRLLCEIRQTDFQSKVKTVNKILIYSYSGTECKLLNEDGYYNYKASVNQIEYFEDDNKIKRKYIIFDFPIASHYRNIRIIESSETINYCRKLEFFYNRQLNLSHCQVYNSDTNILFNNSSYPNKMEGYNRKLGFGQRKEIAILAEILSNPIKTNHVDFSVSRIDEDIIIHILINPNLDFVKKSDYPLLEFSDPKYNRILFASFRFPKNNYVEPYLLFVSYKDFSIEKIDRTQNISTSIDSFFINGRDKMLKRGEYYSPQDKSSAANFLFYSDSKKHIIQLPIYNIHNIPPYNGISIKKLGRFYYSFSGFSNRCVRRLLYLEERYYFEYDFKNKEIIGQIALSTYNDLK